MDEVKFWNVKEFTYHIEIDDTIISVYDEKIKDVSNKLNNIKDEISLYEKLIVLSNSEMKNAKSKDDYNTLVSDKKYFINVLSNYKNQLVGFGTVLNQLYFKKSKLNELLSSVNYYNDNLDNINTVIKQYNYDIIYSEKNMTDFNIISNFKSKLYNIIYFDYSNINVNIDINALKKQYNSLSNIENYYNTNHKGNKLKTDEDYKVTDCDDFIFIDSKNKSIKSRDYSSNNVVGDLDYIAYCDEISNKKRIRHKIKKIRKSSRWNKIKKSLKKNIRKVIAGLLVGVTMFGVSTITTGFDLKNNNDLNKKISTSDSASVDNMTSKVEETTFVQVTDEDLNNVNKDFADEKVDDNKESVTIKKELHTQDTEITIGTSVSASSDIYIDATDAYNKENGMTPYYPVSDERKVSLIYFKNSDGDTVLISEDNKDKIDELKQLKYDVVAYCLDNVKHNASEGWYNKDDVKVLVK